MIPFVPRQDPPPNAEWWEVVSELHQAAEPQPAEWWEIVGALYILPVVAALIAAWVAWRSLSHRKDSDKQAEWWARAQWALDSSMSDDPVRKETGLGVLDLLANSELAGPEEAEIVSLATDIPLKQSHAWLYDAASVGDNGGTDEGQEAST